MPVSVHEPVCIDCFGSSWNILEARPETQLCPREQEAVPGGHKLVVLSRKHPENEDSEAEPNPRHTGRLPGCMRIQVSTWFAVLLLGGLTAPRKATAKMSSVCVHK
jgi:hypothetical protein